VSCLYKLDIYDACKDVPPAVELGKRSEYCRRGNTEPLQGVAKCVVKDPEEETEQIPESVITLTCTIDIYE
jgi:hypothetical protein